MTDQSDSDNYADTGVSESESDTGRVMCSNKTRKMKWCDQTGKDGETVKTTAAESCDEAEDEEDDSPMEGLAVAEAGKPEILQRLRAVRARLTGRRSNGGVKKLDEGAESSGADSADTSDDDDTDSSDRAHELSRTPNNRALVTLAAEEPRVLSTIGLREFNAVATVPDVATGVATVIETRELPEYVSYRWSQRVLDFMENRMMETVKMIKYGEQTVVRRLAYDEKIAAYHMVLQHDGDRMGYYTDITVSNGLEKSTIKTLPYRFGPKNVAAGAKVLNLKRLLAV